MIKVEWADVKSFIDLKQISTKYIEKINLYRIFGYDKDFQIFCDVDKISPPSADQVDFETNYKSEINKPFRQIFYTHTFTAIGTGPVLDMSNSPMKYFSMEVKTTGAVLFWEVVIESSLDNIDYTTIGSHSEITGSGILLFIATPSPSKYIKSNCKLINLGLGTNIVVKILGVE